jgi:hypothetical protein
MFTHPMTETYRYTFKRTSSVTSRFWTMFQNNTISFVLADTSARDVAQMG